MTATAWSLPRRHAARDVGWMLVGLAAASLARSALNGRTPMTAFIAGAAFGVVLVGMAVAGGWRPSRPRLGSLFLGATGGLVLILIPRLIHPLVPAVIGMRPEPFAVWGVVTGVVVMGEEVLLRGALFYATQRAAGALPAVVLTSTAFALMHVPLYGWHVVPLDFGVGVWLAGLRLATGGVAAPAMAHLLADLNTWWA